MITAVQNVSNPAALGVEYNGAPLYSGEEPIRCQLAVLRGTDVVLFAMRTAGGWTRTTTIVNPERFGATPRTFGEMRAWAERFDNGSEV